MFLIFSFSIKRLARDTFIYGVSSLAIKLISVLLFPLFTRVLTPEDYGLINIFNAVIFFSTTLGGLGLDCAVLRWFFESSEKKHEQTLFTNWLFSSLFVSLFIISALILFFTFAHTVSFSTAHNKQAIILAVMSIIILFILPSISLIYFNIHRKPKASLFLSLLIGVSSAFASFWFVHQQRMGVYGFYLGQVVGYGAGTVVSLFYLRKLIRFPAFDFSKLKQMVKYGLFIIPGNITAQFATIIIGFLLIKITSQYELGIYQAAITLSSCITLLIMPLQSALQPMYYSFLERENGSEFFLLVFDLYCALLSFVCLLVCLFFKEIIQIALAPVYIESYLVAAVLVFSNFVYSLNNIAVLGITKVKQVKAFGIVVAAGNLLNILVTYLLASRFGITGAAVATFICQSVIVVILFYISQKKYFIPFRLKANSLIIACAIAFFLAGYWLVVTYQPYAFPLKLSLVFIFCCILIAIHKKYLSYLSDKAFLGRFSLIKR